MKSIHRKAARLPLAAAAIALNIWLAVKAQVIETPNVARLVVAHLGAAVPDGPACEANVQFVGVTSSRTRVETKAVLKPSPKALPEVNAGKLIPDRAPFHARIESGAIVTLSAGGLVAPGTRDPKFDPSSLQIVNNTTGITTNAVVRIGTFKLPAVQ